MTAQQAIATDFFWFIAIGTALFWAGVFIAKLVQTTRIQDAYPTPPPAPQPEPHECTITGCHQPATHAFPTGVTNLDYYACTGHTPTVRQWAGPYDVPYNQDLDVIDLALWETEL